MDPHEVAVMAGVLVVRDRALEALDEAGFRPEHMATPRGTRALSAALEVWRRAAPEAPVSRITIEDAAGALAAPLLDAASDAASEQGASVGTTLYAANALKAAYERRRAENALRVALGALKDGDPPHEVAEDVLEALGEIVNPPRDATVRLGDLVGEALRRLREGGDAKTSTGLGDLDEVMRGGLQGGRLVIAAARPGVGKSALALRIADYVAATAGPALMFGMEMGADETLDRLLSAKSRVHFDGPLNDRDPRWYDVVQAAGDIEGGDVYYHDRAKVNLAEVASVSRALKRRHGLALVVLDYLQLMEVKGENRATALGEVSAGLKQLARQLDVPVIALAQLNREVEKRPGGRPRLADLRESGSLEQDADSVWLMWRPELYLKDEAAKGKVEIHVAKNRSGRTGSVWLSWHGPTTRFDPLDRDEWPKLGGES